MNQEQVTKRLKNVIDNLASQKEYVKREDILKEYYKIYLKRKWNDRLDGSILKAEESKNEANILRGIINRELKPKGVLELQNGRDARAGFRYKYGCENFFANNYDEQRMKRATNDERKMLQTDGLQMLLDYIPVTSPQIELEYNKDLRNLSLIKVLLKYLGKRVIKFRYNSGYADEQLVVLHPHILKEYNSRWFIFGFVQNGASFKVINCSLDRIVYRNDHPNDIMPLTKEECPFLPAPRGYYNNFFNDIVGVTRPEEEVVQSIIVKTTNFKVHQLIKTKPIHYSQQEIQVFDKKENSGAFKLRVIPNIELQARLLSYGDGIYVEGCSNFAKQIANVVMRMAIYYGLAIR